MCAIAVEQRQYETYVLTNSKGSVLEVVPERGGIITRWQVDGQEIFYLDVERFTHPELSVRGGNPILFPLCGNLVDNTYTYHGKPYQLKQHGFARELPWQVVDSEADDRLTLVLQSNEQTHAVYPFDFELRFTYVLDGDRLGVHQRYTNRSAEPMPFSTGFHPYFAVSDKTQLEFEIPATELRNQITGETHPFNNQFDFAQDEIDVIFRNVSAQTARVVDRQSGRALTLTYDSPFSNLVFWTVKGKDFYCLEPWTAARNALNTGDSLIYLDPGTSLELNFEMAVEIL